MTNESTVNETLRLIIKLYETVDKDIADDIMKMMLTTRLIVDDKGLIKDIKSVLS